MKKVFAAGILAAAVLLNISFASAESLGKSTSYNTANLSSGIIALAYDAQTDARLKVLVEKDGKRVSYDLKNDGTVESFPLQMGDGEYKVSILENVVDTKYRYISTEKVNLDLEDDRQVYLASVQNVNWTRDMVAIKKADELVKGLETDKQKIDVIYDYLVSNITYDYAKLKTLQSGYLPNIDNTITTKKGICYDYASLFASMLRSQGIPAKLVKGYATKVTGYHAWNEVYNRETGKWIIIDTTYDAEMKQHKAGYSMEKNAADYDKVYEY
jgi:transglutaminase-like putative cysteine protease